jgi:hypothetical protein
MHRANENSDKTARCVCSAASAPARGANFRQQEALVFTKERVVELREEQGGY